MDFDFSQEENQSENRIPGPVPGGSIVLVRMELLEPMKEYGAPEHYLIRRTKQGLRMLYVEMKVTEGRYAGCSWRQSITLPMGMQREPLNENQQTAARIGGSTLRAILAAAGKNLRVNSLETFDGLVFPVKVRIAKDPYTTDSGEECWRNELSRVITPDMPEYERVLQAREIINENGPVQGTKSAKSKKPMAAAFSSPSYGDSTTSARIDDVPF